MIETTYIKLEKAAELLGTDRDTLIIAAVEGRIQLYGFLGRAYEVTYMVPMEVSPQFCNGWRGEGSEYKWFDFAPLDRGNAAEILKHGNTTIEEDLSDVNPVDGGKWKLRHDYYDDEMEEIVEAVSASLIIQRDHIFVKREEIEKIISLKTLPLQDTIPASPPQRNGAAIRVHNTHHRIIGGLLQLMLSGINEKGEKISKYTAADQIISDMEDNFPTAHGLKKSNLQSVFAEAKRAIKDA